jgi:hypothetical protein
MIIRKFKTMISYICMTTLSSSSPTRLGFKHKLKRGWMINDLPSGELDGDDTINHIPKEGG